MPERTLPEVETAERENGITMPISYNHVLRAKFETIKADIERVKNMATLRSILKDLIYQSQELKENGDFVYQNEEIEDLLNEYINKIKRTLIG